jgi:diguanylate cyclase (GGDEF)-like protein
MKLSSTIVKRFNLFGKFVLLFHLCTVTTFSIQASETLQQYSSNIRALAKQEITTKLNLADSIKRSNPTKFKQLVFELMQQSPLTTEQQHHLSLLHSYHLTFVGDYQLAEMKLKKILESNASDLLLFRANYALINISMPKKNWLEGLKYVNKNINTLSSIQDEEHYQNGLLITIIFYNQIGQYELAESYIELLAKEELSAKNECWLKQLSLEAKLKSKQLHWTDKALKETLEQCIKIGNTINANIVRTYQAKLYLEENMPEKALNMALNNLAEVHKTEYPMLIAEMSNTIAETYWQLEDINNAKRYANDALAVNRNNTNLLQGVNSYYLLYKIAKSQQNPTLALSYYEQYAEIEKAHLEGEKAKELAFQLAEHQALEKVSQIKLLNEQNNALSAEQALAKTKVSNRQLVIILLIFIIAILTLLGFRLMQVHQRVKKLAKYDALTGIYNRGHFTQIALSTLKYCQSAEQDLSVIVFDLDHFKKINDSFGHLCGDWALKEVSKACQAIGRKNDIFARLGGEEFCIMLPSCNIRMATLRAEACRAAIEAIMTETSGYEFTITASFGVTDVCLSGFNLDKLLADADATAYQSKHAGRNQVTVHQVKNVKKEQLSNSTLVISKRAT